MISFRQIQEMSRRRANRWHDGAEPWSLLEWAGAMCGEAGEAANVAKKIKRVDQGMWNSAFASLKGQTLERERLVHELNREVADTILYAMCLLNETGADAETLLQMVFNEKSIAAGFPERL